MLQKKSGNLTITYLPDELLPEVDDFDGNDVIGRNQIC